MSHHFRGIRQYAEQLMDLAEGRPAFTGRGQKPSNKEVLAAIASIKKCRRGSFFDKPSSSCSCGWHTKAAARKRARQAEASASSAPTVTSAPSSSLVTSESSSHSTSPLASVEPATALPSTSGSVPSTAAAAPPAPPPVGSGPVPPNFNRSDFQSPTISELRVIGIGTKTAPGKLDLLVYCPLKGRCPHCKSTLITANSVGKRKLCYAVPWPKTIVGVDMRCYKCKKHFMTHDTTYVDTLPSEEQVKREFVSGKGYGSHISLLRLLRSGLTVAQVERYVEDEVRQHYLRIKSQYIELWDKVILINYFACMHVCTARVVLSVCVC